MTPITPERLVVRAPNWLGDLVMSLPAMAMICRGFPEAEISVAAPAPFAAVFEQRTPAGVVDVIRPDALDGDRFDAVLLLTNSFGSAWQARRAGIAQRWGYAAAGRRWLLTRAVRRPRGRVHQVEYYRALARGLELPEADAGPRVEPGARALERAAAFASANALEGPLVGFAPGAAYGHAKRWPPRYVAEVIASVANTREVTCVLFGAAGDVEAGREIESALGPRGLARGRVVNLIGRTDLSLLIGLLARCRAFVTNDSGSMHLASAMGVPVVAMFGPTSEQETGPAGAQTDVLTADVFCRPCMLRECPIDHRCMKRITPERALAAVLARLA